MLSQIISWNTFHLLLLDISSIFGFQTKSNRVDIDEKCKKVEWFHEKSSKLKLNDEQRVWFEKFFETHIQLCDEMKKTAVNDDTKKMKPNTNLEFPNATKDFVKLETFKSYVIESNLDDF